MSDIDRLTEVHRTLIGFNKRAERSSDEALVASFVDAAPLFDLLSTPNNQVIYGRRGTGKTHALKYLARKVEERGHSAIYLDLRSIGSNGSIYSDASRPLPERTSTLLLDVLGALVDELYRIALLTIDRHPSPELVTRRLDAVQHALSRTQISGDIATESVEKSHQKDSNGLSLGAKLTPSPSIEATVKLESDLSHETSHKVNRTGKEVPRLVFGNISGSIGDLIQILAIPRIWLLIDEWSELPVDLQPYLADLLRRTLLPVNSITIKIAAIEHRSAFVLHRTHGEYIGLELGADVSADLNLDDFLVFDNDQAKSTQFLQTLLFKHYENTRGSAPEFSNANLFIQAVFTQIPAFEEFVRAVEGVPRDALNLANKIATKAFGQKVSIQHVRSAAQDWYNQDKAAVIRGNEGLNELLAHIVDKVIAGRRARAFLLQSNIRHEGIDKLFDSRLLHILKKNISSHDQPGLRFDVYKIDYGCYVDLINTTKAPRGLFIVDDTDEYSEVPRDDYRSIRRAILRPDDIPLIAARTNDRLEN